MDKPLAVALRYDKSLPAPFVTALGKDHLAERMLAVAQEYGVPVQSAPELAERLFVVEPGECIPEGLYEPIAQIFAFLLDMEHNVGRLNYRKNESNRGN